MAYKMKGFGGFKESPLKAVDAGLIKAADNMDRGLKEPTSLIGEGVAGFLDGYLKSSKSNREKALINAIKGNDAYDNLEPYKPTENLQDELNAETKRLQEEFDKKIESENPPTEINKIEIKPISFPQNEEITVGPPETDKVIIKEKDLDKAKKRRNKRNRRRNKN